MTKMIQYVDDIRARLTEIARAEHTLIRALDEALTQVDQELLADVRDLTLAHEARRVAILTELQTLASRIGAFPAPPVAHPALEANGHATPPAEAPAGPGDWRKAVSNIKDELDSFFERGVQH